MPCSACGQPIEPDYDTDGYYYKVQRVDACGHAHEPERRYCDACFEGASDHLYQRTQAARQVTKS